MIKLVCLRLPALAKLRGIGAHCTSSIQDWHLKGYQGEWRIVHVETFEVTLFYLPEPCPHQLNATSSNNVLVTNKLKALPLL
jgi:hypothetical protein